MRIRPATPDDRVRMTEIWLEGSRQAHEFIPAAYWESKAEEMREHYLPMADSWVMEGAAADGGIAGFVSLVGDYLAALFIDPERQGEGLGGRLLKQAQAERPSLTLKVYEQNEKAAAFYKRHGFTELEKTLDEATGESEQVLYWTSTGESQQ